ncbi:hypothetical protein NC652_007000 [Populus alba x Populus x berolinensis]|nr:hypothetical protein NC652_006994 [Populus alba x Populus x berolinensis]KAJ6955755.1 hypothetical protein NC652_007000 [Populus alba x Populus x berolinensis]
MNNMDCWGMSTSQLNLLKEVLDCNLECLYDLSTFFPQIN